jgi:hypothetical protein
MTLRFTAACAALILSVAAAPAAVVAASPPAEWDGLTKIDSRKLDAVYLRPGADFRTYTKVMLDPTEVAFRKNYRRDINQDRRDPGSWVSASDMTRVSAEVQKGFGKIFTDAYQKAGYQVVTTPGPDVLRLRTGVADLYVAAPDVMTASRTRTFSEEAGEATLVLEVRDSETGELLGRAIDRRNTGDMGPYLRNSVSNASEFENLFRTWAKKSVDGLAELKSRSPLPGATAAAAPVPSTAK